MANAEKNQSQTTKAALSDAEMAEILNDIKAVNDTIPGIIMLVNQALEEIGNAKKKIDFLFKELESSLPEVTPLQEDIELPFRIEGVNISKASLSRALKRYGFDNQGICNALDVILIEECGESATPFLSIKFRYLDPSWFQNCTTRHQNRTYAESEGTPNSSISRFSERSITLGQALEFAGLRPRKREKSLQRAEIHPQALLWLQKLLELRGGSTQHESTCLCS
ncbi:hypothetical protein [Desulforegula conservatrix]|uniref:hypothetical protein n=1 Tax=Desulforegula conservatrix TaxID=153026 RepID=UPI0003FFE7CD|nr:hypothetical protein [Desulforegula conservatrix]